MALESATFYFKLKAGSAKKKKNIVPVLNLVFATKIKVDKHVPALNGVRGLDI